MPQPRLRLKAVRLLFWNIWYDSSPDAILKAVKTFDCDVLILSEMDGNTYLPDYIHNLGYGGMFVETNHFGLWREVSGGIALFSKLLIENARYVELRHGGRGPLRGGSASRRCYIEATLRVSEDFCLTIGGTHLSYELPYDQQACMQEQSALLNEVGKHQHRFVFGGDLNALPNSRIVCQLSERLTHLGPDLVEPSWPVRRIIKRFLRPRRFDYAFATPDIKAMAEFGNDFSSDHRPIVVQLQMPSSV
ncbi:endonuclease/exonuclease/phosphatase family protein [Candidatus Kaiserbacteria bacterium]|nr:endonuclease/exonuclease/phosphatase family protein [Candidatus Kaiserbacteria bacterium]